MSGAPVFQHRSHKMVITGIAVLAFAMNKMPTYWWGWQNVASLKFGPKPSEAAFRMFFLDKCRPEEASDVISGVLVDPTVRKVTVKFGDSMSNRTRYI